MGNQRYQWNISGKADYSEHSSAAATPGDGSGPAALAHF